MAHDICVDFKPAADLKSMQRPSRRWGKYCNYRTQCSIYEGIILPQQKKS